MPSGENDDCAAPPKPRPPCVKGAGGEADWGIAAQRKPRAFVTLSHSTCKAIPPTRPTPGPPPFTQGRRGLNCTLQYSFPYGQRKYSLPPKPGATAAIDAKEKSPALLERGMKAHALASLLAKVARRYCQLKRNHEPLVPIGRSKGFFRKLAAAPFCLLFREKVGAGCAEGRIAPFAPVPRKLTRKGTNRPPQGKSSLTSQGNPSDPAFGRAASLYTREAGIGFHHRFFTFSAKPARWHTCSSVPSSSTALPSKWPNT